VAVLELSSISKNFGAIQALQDVSLQLEGGQVLGLMGDNGAGKSTLVKIIAGNFRPSHGSIVIDGAQVNFHRPIEARQHGVEIVYQDLALCDNLTAAANVFLGRELRKYVGPIRILDYGRMYRRAGELFKELKSETRPRDLVRQMSGGQRQAVAIARTRLSDPKIVLMDEPTAAISDRMPDVFAVADRIAVLRRGRMVASKEIKDSSPEEVTGLITGAIQTA
jgi:simple sugar transport system ATP-binding protein